MLFHGTHKYKIMENNTPTQPNYYGVLPAPVRYSKELSASEKVLYAEISALSNTNGYCWASNAYFANLYSVEERQITRWVSGLSKSNFVRTETIYIAQYNKTERRIYLIDLPKHDSHPVKKDDPTPSKKTTPPRQKRQEPPVKKDGHNTTTNNTRTENSEEDTNVSSSSLEGSEIAIAIPSPSVEFFDFDVWAIQNELYELLKFPARLKKEKFAEKRKELTDTFFYKIMSDINGYIKNNPTYLDGVPATATKGAVEGKKQLASVLTTFVKKYNSNSNNTQITPFESVPDLREIYVNFWHSISYGAPCILGKHDLTNLKELAQKLKDANRSSGMPSMSEKDLLKVFLQHIPTFWRVSEKATPYILNRDCATIISQMHNSKNKSTHSASKLDLQAGVELMQQMDDQRTQAPKVMEAMGNFYADYISKFQNQNQNETPKP